METVEPTSRPAEGAEAWDNESHPWRRYGARMLDLWIFSGVIFAIIGVLAGLMWPSLADALVYPSQWASYLVFPPLSAIIGSVGTAFCLSRWGTTVGKWLFGVRVLKQGERLDLRQALIREARLLWWGLGAGIPLLSLGMAIRSYSEVEEHRQSRWDQSIGSEVYARAPQGWQYAGIVLGALLVIALKTFDAISRIAERFSAG